MNPKSIKFVAMTIHEARQKLLFQLFHVYDQREASNIADWVMEYLTGWKKIDRIVNKNLPLRTHQIHQLEKYIEELLAHKPVQYVLNEAWFMGRRYYVDENVLIPRPETEELVSWIIADHRSKSVDSSNLDIASIPQTIIIDIGTGSGCISIELKTGMPEAIVYACDISPGAIKVAQKNALAHKAEVNFIEMDFLDKDQWDHLPDCNILVSNPPYIPSNEKGMLKQNVVQYEPHIALFVSDNDPLLFYEYVAEFGTKKLQLNGSIYVEIPEDSAEKISDLFKAKNYVSVEIKKDLQGKDRMIRTESLPINNSYCSD